MFLEVSYLTKEVLQNVVLKAADYASTRNSFLETVRVVDFIRVGHTLFQQARGKLF